MEWISVVDKLPKNNQSVLILLGESNIQYANFKMGRYYSEVDPHKGIHGEDQFGNNLVPYKWQSIGAYNWFGQEVLYWSPLPIISDNLVDNLRNFNTNLGFQGRADYILNNKKW